MVEPTDGTLFRAEYEREMEAWLRRRFGWLLGATIGYEVLSLLFAIGGLLVYRLTRDADLSEVAKGDPQDTEALEALRDNAPEFLTFTILATILVLAVTARAFISVRPRLESREQTLRATNWFILEIGAITVAADLAMQLLVPDAMGVKGASGLSTIFFLHILPSIFLPWSPRESLRPMYPLATMFILELVVLKLAGRVGTGEVVGMLALAPLMLAPGLALNWWRIRTHRRRFDRQMPERLKQEVLAKQ